MAANSSVQSGGKLALGELDPVKVNPDLPRFVAKKLAESGNTLGIEGLKIIEEGPPTPMIAAPSLDREDARILDIAGISLQRVAQMAAFEAQGHEVPKSLHIGLMMPKAENDPDRYSERLKDLQKCSTEVLVKVAETTRSKHRELVREEAALRFDNWIQFDQAARDQLGRVPPGMGRDKYKEQMFESFLKTDFSVQKNRGKDPHTGHVPKLKDEKIKLMMSLDRGFKTIKNILMSRNAGIDIGSINTDPKKAAEAQRSNDWTKTANSQPQRRPRERGGVEM